MSDDGRQVIERVEGAAELVNRGHVVLRGHGRAAALNGQVDLGEDLVNHRLFLRLDSVVIDVDVEALALEGEDLGLHLQGGGVVGLVLQRLGDVLQRRVVVEIVEIHFREVHVHVGRGLLLLIEDLLLFLDESQVVLLPLDRFGLGLGLRRWLPAAASAFFLASATFASRPASCARWGSVSRSLSMTALLRNSPAPRQSFLLRSVFAGFHVGERGGAAGFDVLLALGDLVELRAELPVLLLAEADAAVEDVLELLPGFVEPAVVERPEGFVVRLEGLALGFVRAGRRHASRARPWRPGRPGPGCPWRPAFS